MSLEDPDAAERWLELSENRSAWERLEQALELADGFQFLPVHLVNAAAEDRLRALLAEWCRREKRHLAGFRLDEPPGGAPLLSLVLRELQSANRPCVFFFPCGKALYRGARTPEGQDKLRDFFLFLNQKRDVIARRADAPLVISLHPGDWKEFRRHAPDFWSIHQAVWRFAGPVMKDQGPPLGLGAPLEPPETVTEILGPPVPIAPRPASTIRPASFVGRERELLIITATLRSGSEHVVIEGLAGVGKTALALEAAHQLTSIFRDGLLAFDLSGVTDPAAATTIMSRVVGHFHPSGSLPSSIGRMRASYLSATRQGRALLILENVGNAAILQQLEPAEGCRLLVTSRGNLRLPESYRRVSLSGLALREGRRWLEGQVRGLSREHAAALTQALAGHLLSMRVAAGLLDPSADGDPKALLARLRPKAGAVLGVFQVTVETAVEALGPDQRFLWRRLAIFQSPFGVRRAAAVSGLERHLVRGILEELVRRQLIDAAEGQERHGMHRLLRELAKEQLRKAGDETPARDAHARYFLDLLLHTVAPASGEGPARDGVSLDEVAGERLASKLPAELREELAAAQAWVLERSNAPDPVARKARELVLKVGVAGAEALAEAQTPIQRLAWAEVLRQTAQQKGFPRLAEDAALLGSRAQLDRASSEKYFRWVLEIARSRGDRTREAEALGNLGIAQDQAGELEAAQRSYQQALGIFQQLEDAGGESWVLARLGGVLDAAGQLEKAVETYERALELTQQLGDTLGSGRILSGLAEVHARAGSYSEAVPLYEQAIETFRDHEEIQEEGKAQIRLANALTSLRRHSEATVAFQKAGELARRVGDLAGTMQALIGQGQSLIQVGDPRSASAYFEQALEISRELGSPGHEAVVLVRLGLTRDSLGEPDSAIELLKQALRIGHELGAPAIFSMAEKSLERVRRHRE